MKSVFDYPDYLPDFVRHVLLRPDESFVIYSQGVKLEYTPVTRAPYTSVLTISVDKENNQANTLLRLADEIRKQASEASNGD